MYDDERLDGRPPAEDSSATGRDSLCQPLIPTNRCEDVTRFSTERGSDGSGESSQRVAQERDLVGGAGGNAECVGSAERAEWPDDHALPEERIVQALGVADADEREVRDGRAGGLEGMLPENLHQQCHRVAIQRPTAGDLGLIPQAGDRGLLPCRCDVECTAHLADGRDHVGRPDAVADS